MLSEVSYRYNEEGRTIFSGVDLSATMESRICIVGENGAGGWLGSHDNALRFFVL